MMGDFGAVKGSQELSLWCWGMQGSVGTAAIKVVVGWDEGLWACGGVWGKERTSEQLNE